MNKHKKRLQKLLEENKISTEEFIKLNTVFALRTKKSTITSMIYDFIANPFMFVSGIIALLLAIGLLAIMSLLAWYGQFRFHGLLDHTEIPLGQHMGILAIFAEVFIAWIIISCSFLFLSRLFKALIPSTIDIFSYCGLAKFPYFILGILLLIIKSFDLSFFMTAGDKAGLQSTLGYIWMLVFYTLYFWQLRLYFCALKESCGLYKNRLWFVYIISIVFSEVLTLQFISTIFG